jgi:hypothetical protein
VSPGLATCCSVRSAAPDAALGPSPGSVYVRAEREGTGTGRIYQIAYSVNDGQGATCTGTAMVTVPHDQSGRPVLDTGARYNSFGS